MPAETIRKMKDSGIEWVGLIPEDWGIIRIKYLMYEKKDKTQKGCETRALSVTQDRGIIRSVDAKVANPSSSYDDYLEVRKGDLVFNKYKAHSGVFFVTPLDGIVTFNYSVYRCFSNAIAKYYEYLFKTAGCISEFNKRLHGVGESISPLYTKDLFEIAVPIPSTYSQTSIVSFLDAKCAEIDSLRADIEKEIETLEEYKKSVITEAVTKGLDPNAPMKDSEVFYMAPYNASWRLTKIGYECMKLWRSFSPDDTPLLCTNKGKVSIRPEEMSGRMVSEDNAMQGIHKGDIAIHGMDTWHGAIAISEHNGKITRVVHVCDSSQDKRFIVYYLQQLAFNGVYKLISNGVRGNTSDFRSWDKVADIYIALPSIEEQKKIADYLDLILKQIEEVAREKRASLDILDEYRKSIIYEYVTGKKEVSDVVL